METFAQETRMSKRAFHRHSPAFLKNAEMETWLRLVQLVWDKRQHPVSIRIIAVHDWHEIGVGDMRYVIEVSAE